jgi:hypothetical protein
VITGKFPVSLTRTNLDIPLEPDHVTREESTTPSARRPNHGQLLGSLLGCTTVPLGFCDPIPFFFFVHTDDGCPLFIGLNPPFQWFQTGHAGWMLEQHSIVSRASVFGGYEGVLGLVHHLNHPLINQQSLIQEFVHLIVSSMGECRVC